MEYLIHRFSEWLDSNNIKNHYTRIKGGYILTLENIDDKLSKTIKSVTILKDSNPKSKERAILVPMTFFSEDGKEIILTDEQGPTIMSTLQPVIRDYIILNSK